MSGHTFTTSGDSPREWSVLKVEGLPQTEGQKIATALHEHGRAVRDAANTLASALLVAVGILSVVALICSALLA